MPSLNVQGYSVNYDDDSKLGMDYLFSLSYVDLKTLLEKAEVNGSAPFTYGSGGYKIASNGGDIFTLSKSY